MTKIKTIPKLKKKLDQIFSKYIRHKYAKDGMVKCYTCQHIGEVKKMQNGHFNPRQHLATRYDERNCRPQCFACNMYYGGNPAVFASKLIDEYGPEIITEFKQARHQVFKVDQTWYENKIKEYEEKLNEVVDNSLDIT